MQIEITKEAIKAAYLELLALGNTNRGIEAAIRAAISKLDLVPRR